MIDQLAKDILNDIKTNVEKAKEHFSGETNNNDSAPASQLRSIIESTLKRMNLVTREEFDAQKAVLTRTREKLEALEQHVAEIEEKIATK